MKPTTKQFLENGLISNLYAFFYSSLLSIAILTMFKGINVSVEHPMYLLVGCWAIFILFEIIWARLKSEIREVVNEKPQSK